MNWIATKQKIIQLKIKHNEKNIQLHAIIYRNDFFAFIRSFGRWFRFCVATFYCFPFFSSAAVAEPVCNECTFGRFIKASNEREARNYLWWLRNCILLFFMCFFYRERLCNDTAESNSISPGLRISSHFFWAQNILCILFSRASFTWGITTSPNHWPNKQNDDDDGDGDIGVGTMTLRHCRWKEFNSLNAIFWHNRIIFIRFDSHKHTPVLNFQREKKKIPQPNVAMPLIKK